LQLAAARGLHLMLTSMIRSQSAARVSTDGGPTVSDIKDTLKHAGEKIAEKAEQAKDWVKEKTGLGEKDCGRARSTADIQPHMDVISSCGCKMGKVDHLEGGAIKLTKNDSPDGQHHFVPMGWVARVDQHVHLSTNADETKQGWKADAASCAGCGA
jgi:hypothetical protein